MIVCVCGVRMRLPLRTYITVGSKSLSDIHLSPLPSVAPPLYRSSLTFDISVEAATAGQMRQEHMRRVHGSVRETDDKWQEDLTRWKDRRRSTNSNLQKKKEEREQMEVNNTNQTRPYGDSLQKGEREDPGNCVTATTCHPAQAHTPAHTHHLQNQQEADFAPRSRASLSRGDAVDLPSARAPSRGRLPPSEPVAQGESLSLGSLPSDLASTPTFGFQAGAAMPGLTGSNGSPGGAERGTGTSFVPSATSPPPLSTSSALKVHWNSPVSSTLTGSPLTRPRSAQYSASEGPDSQEEQEGAGSIYRPTTPAGKPYDGGSRVSASLPRGFRRSEGSSCLSAGVTPRPFGAKTSRMSLSKLYSKDDSHKSLMSNQKDRPVYSSVTAPYGKVTTPVDPFAPPTQSNPKQESREEEGLRSGRSSVTANPSSSPKFTASLPDYTSRPPTMESEVLHSDMRVSLNQRPNSGTDFGFQTHWDSTGVRITSIQPGSPAEQCHLREGDEILSVNGHSVAQLSYNQWKGSMADALAKGTLLMDVRRHGHAGRPERYVNVSQDHGVTAAPPAKPLTNGLPVNGVGPTEMNGGYHDNAEPLQNKGGSESAISDLQVPSISASASRWSWDPEEDRKKHESWQKEQERLLQEKYQRDQQRLEDEWRRAQQEVGDVSNHDDGFKGAEEYRGFERTNGSTPLPFSSQSTPSMFATSNQYVEGEGPVKAREQPVHSAEGPLPKEAGLDEYEGPNTNHWPDESYGFATLASTDRSKSKSTPTLDSFFNQEQKEPAKEFSVEKRLGQQMSQVEFERQQILDEMRKRTQLHTDSSWIRQRSSSSSYQKEPIVLGAPVRRFESLDDLHSGGSWTRPSSAASNPMRSHSAMGSSGGYRGPGRHSMGAIGGGATTLPAALSASSLRQGPWARPASTSPTPTPLREEGEGSPQRMSKPLSGRRMCTRCERPLAKGAAMVIESLGLCYHLACFKCASCCTELRRPGPGSQVRVRNKQLYCDTCYGRLRARPMPK
ncbi:hypothetical protein ACEWY4_016713 [Coilia grayii]|uniref:LIM domain only protein 7-like n=1 Tax=Coilia grayii TaxID=363190 RepID=A0ABD1JNK1_9TELE